MKKFIKFLFTGFPILLIAALVAIYFSLDWITKNGIETFGPKITRTDVALKKATMSPFSGEGKMQGIRVGNPDGFKTEKAFELEEVRVAVKVDSLFSDRIIIDEILVNAPDIVYEMKGSTSNIKTILDNIRSFAGPSKGRSEKDTGKKRTKKEEKKLQINHFIVENGRVHMSADLLEGKKISMALPDIHLKDIGAGKEGKTASEVLEEIFASVNNEIAGTVSGSAKTFKEKAKKTIDSLKDRFKKIFGK